MKYTNLILTIIIAAAVGWGAARYAAPTQPKTVATTAKETAYDRVLRTGTLRCGYGTWKPGVYKDPASSEMRGIFVELVNAIGRLNGLKVEWTAEVDWGQIAPALNSGKIDAFCAGMAGDAARGKAMAYTNPLSYWTFDVLVRADETRFPQTTATLADLNKPEYATAYTEGDVLETLAKTELPLARGVALPPLGTPADNIMHVLTHKTDFVIFPKVMFQEYDRVEPGKLRHLRVVPPLRAYGNVIAVGMDDSRLQQLLNAGIAELVGSGAYTQIMARYNVDYPQAFLPVLPQYKAE